MKKKIIIIGVLILFLIILLSSGTFAYFRWQSSPDEDIYVGTGGGIAENFSCAADGGGDINPGDVYLVPASCTNSDHAIVRKIKTKPKLGKSNPVINFKLFLDVELLDIGLSNSQNFNYALTTSNTSCEEGVVSSGNFYGKQVGDQITILDKDYEESSVDTFYLYIWLDSAETSTSTMNQNFNLSISGQCEEIDSIGNGSGGSGGSVGADGANVPVLDDGMIPVTIANNGTVTTVSSSDSSWYNYDNKEWANVVLVNSSSRTTYKTPGTTIPESDILAYYVWIPRYKYQIWTVDATTTTDPQTINIEFESKTASVSSGTTVGSWKTHPAFIWDGNTVAGIWVGKFETGHSTLSSSTTSNNLSCTDENCTNADGLIIKPNVRSLRFNSVSNQFYASRSMSRSGNPFGLSSSITNTHLMKNSEWGAVAYLSHSQYGINYEIRINNNILYTTGCGASAENGSSTSSCEIAYGGATSYPQSTTGNITGVFDMSGGIEEYVMGNYDNTISSAGFTTMPSSKYYDVYLSAQFTEDGETNMSLCTIETCGGHALFETAGWYSDYFYFVDVDYPWFLRGSGRSDGSDGGVWSSIGDYGNALSLYGVRSVAIVGV